MARVGVTHSVSAALLVSLTTAHTVSAYLVAVPARLLVVPAEPRILSANLDVRLLVVAAERRILGLKGARVRGIDISMRAIEIANNRAVLHGVADRVQFICTPLEVYAESEKEPFDIICGWAVLHHVLPVLDSVLIALKKLASPRTIFLFTEPVSMWQWLRNLRLMLPMPFMEPRMSAPSIPGISPSFFVTYQTSACATSAARSAS